MAKNKTSNNARVRRHIRVRKKLRGTSSRPRLAVFRSNQHIYAQVIDDSKSITLASASSGDKGLTAEISKAKSKIVQGKGSLEMKSVTRISKFD